MSSVVLRCPNCGTTRTALGECEACHEAQVRYHCTNHTPGRWLDASACPQCGARFGDPARPPAPPAPPEPKRRRPAPATSGVPTAAVPTRPRPAPPAGRPAADGGGPWGRREEPPTAREHEREGDDESFTRGPRGAGPFATWQELLWAAARVRRIRTETAPHPEVVPPGRGFGGCLLRLVILVVFLFLAVTMAPFFLLQLFGMY